MKTEILKEFIVLAQYLNYSIAAEKIHIAQPRLSVHIAELEKEIGFRLFTREKPLSLTLEGKRFLNAADRVLGELDAAIADGVKTSRNKAETLAIMRPPFMEAFPASFSYGLSQSLDEIARLYPYLDISMPNTFDSRSELDILLEGKSDICYVLQCGTKSDVSDEGFRSEAIVHSLLKIGFVAWVNASHPLAKQDEVSLSEIADYPIVVPGCLEISSYRVAVEDLFRSKDITPVFRSVFTEGPAAFAVYLPKDEELILSPDFISRSNMGLKRLVVSCDQSVSIGIAYLKSHTKPIVKTFVDILLSQPHER